MYCHTKNQVSKPRLSKATPQIGQTHRQTSLNLLPCRICGC